LNIKGWVKPTVAKEITSLYSALADALTTHSPHALRTAANEKWICYQVKALIQSLALPKSGALEENGDGVKSCHHG